MDRAVFSNDIVTFYDDLRFSVWPERQILRRGTDNRSMSNKIAGPNSDNAFEDDVRLHDRMVAKSYLGTNQCTRPDFYVASNSRTRVDDCSRMDLQRIPASLKLK